MRHSVVNLHVERGRGVCNAEVIWGCLFVTQGAVFVGFPSNTNNLNKTTAVGIIIVHMILREPGWELIFLVRFVILDVNGLTKIALVVIIVTCIGRPLEVSGTSFPDTNFFRPLCLRG